MSPDPAAPALAGSRPPPAIAFRAVHRTVRATGVQGMRKLLRTIAVLAEGTAGSAIRRAARLASRDDAAIVLVSVGDGSSALALADVLTQADWLRTQHGLTRVLVCAVAADDLAAASAAWDLLVMDGLPPGLRAWFGTPADVLRTCACPVLLSTRRGGARYVRALAPVGLESRIDPIAQAATGLVGAAEVHALHVMQTSEEQLMQALGVPQQIVARHWRDRVEATRRRLEARFPDDGPSRPARLHVRPSGAMAAHLVSATRTFGVDLVALRAWRSRFPVGRLHLGVARHLMAEAGCDVLVVPSPAA